MGRQPSSVFNLTMLTAFLPRRSQAGPLIYFHDNSKNFPVSILSSCCLSGQLTFRSSVFKHHSQHHLLINMQLTLNFVLLATALTSVVAVPSAPEAAPALNHWPAAPRPREHTCCAADVPRRITASSPCPQADCQLRFILQHCSLASEPQRFQLCPGAYLPTSVSQGSDVHSYTCDGRQRSPTPATVDRAQPSRWLSTHP